MLSHPLQLWKYPSFHENDDSTMSCKLSVVLVILMFMIGWGPKAEDIFEYYKIASYNDINIIQNKCV